MSSNFSDLEPNVKVAIFEITNLTILKSESSHFLLLFDHSLKKKNLHDGKWNLHSPQFAEEVEVSLSLFSW